MISGVYKNGCKWSLMDHVISISICLPLSTLKSWHMHLVVARLETFSCVGVLCSLDLNFFVCDQSSF
jgi:hypothetical protein